MEESIVLPLRRYIIRNEHDHIVISAGAVKGEPFLAGIKVRKL